jgi:endonuclease/exonuclease/phosphatase family metal-dependent hydrolase
MVESPAPLALAILAASACADAVGDQPRPSIVVTDAGSDTGPEPVGPPARGAVRVATFNVHRLFDTVCDSASCGGTAFEEVVTQAELDARVAELGRGIAKLDADVLALQEIENAVVFDALRERLSGSGYVTAELGETGAPASMDVAIVARGSAIEIRRHRDEPLTRPDGTATTFSRELLEVRLALGERRVFVFAAHFRSKVDDDPGRRIAEANRTREIMVAASAEDPSALVVLGGDLNDEPGSEAIRALEGDGALVRVAQDLGAEAQTTFVREGRGLAIDHVFVTSSGASRYVPKSAAVVPDLGSDHAALRADFDQK